MTIITLVPKQMHKWVDGLNPKIEFFLGFMYWFLIWLQTNHYSMLYVFNEPTIHFINFKSQPFLVWDEAYMRIMINF